MASIHPSYEYDIFISYRQNDNKRDGWVTEFVSALKAELEATVKNPVSIYFDENPHDGLLETHQVNQSLAKKLKCLIFIPIVSQTYCDTNGYAWQHEFLAFIKMAEADEIGMSITLANGNVAGRVLPIQIHDLDAEDRQVIEKELRGPLRSIPFIYKSAGVNRPLRIKDSDLGDNQNKTNYLNQINKVANALKEIGTAILRNKKESEETRKPQVAQQEEGDFTSTQERNVARWWSEAKRRNVPRAAIAYIAVAWLMLQAAESISRLISIPKLLLLVMTVLIFVGFPVALILAWKFERGPTGFIPTDSKAARESPFRPSQKKPFSSNATIIALLVFVTVISISQRYWLPILSVNDKISIAIIPFQSNSFDENQKHYGVGLASEVRTALSQTKRFEFISSLQATLQYSNSKESPEAIGNNLGVTHILSGFYEISGTTIQITVELVDAKNGNIIWSLPYKAPLTDIFNIQADIASKVTDRFAFDMNDTRTVATTNLPAYTHYLKGFELLNAGWSKEIYDNATKEFESAIELDSSYLPAWVGLVNATADMIWEINASDSSLHRKAKKDIEYIHKHFPESWQTKQADAIYQYHVLSNYQEGKRLFEEVLKEDPENVMCNQFAAAIHKRKLEFPEAMKLYTKAKNQWPKSVSVWSEIGEVFMSMGDIENEAKVNKILLELGGTDIGKARTFNAAQRNGTLEQLPAEVIDWNKARYVFQFNFQKRNWEGVRKLLDTIPRDPAYPKLSAYHAMGLKDSMRQVAKRYLRNSKKIDFNPRLTGMAYSALGKEELGLKIMDSLWFNNNNLVPINKEDRLMQARQKADKVLVMTMAEDYKGATELLLSINRDYPNFGDYSIFYNSPLYDRIKKEYPAFNKALTNLKMTQKLILDKPIKL